VQVVGPADRLAADEDLRKGRTPRLLAHLGALLLVHGGVDLLKVDALALEQGQGAGAVGTELTGVDDDRLHG
jgi:hypothetical protein